MAAWLSGVMIACYVDVARRRWRARVLHNVLLLAGWLQPAGVRGRERPRRDMRRKRARRGRVLVL
eukprot:6163729-Pleurochrysis_carterae.AAC.5